MLGEHAERGVDDGLLGLLAARAAGRRGRDAGCVPATPGPVPACSVRAWSGMLCSTTVLAFAADMDLAFHPGLGGDTRRDLSGIRHHAGPEVSRLVPRGSGLGSPSLDR